ncbi:MAG TPA: hypothetical protein PLQ93_01890 [Bacteroidia bacterium]|nr:hypothetical protein [Bacteroidia bacterium]
MNIHNRQLPLIFLISLLGLLMACQKKDVLEAKDPVQADTSTKLICPGCTFPDTVWHASGIGAKLIFRLNFDSSLTRLNSLGQPGAVSGNLGAQSPIVKRAIINYIELMPESNSEPGKGVLLYSSPETSCGGLLASNFCEGISVRNHEVVFSHSFQNISPGTYKWLRISVLYTELDLGVHSVSSGNTRASFGGFCGNRTYLSQLSLAGSVLTPSLGGTGNRNMGYWIYRSEVLGLEQKFDGQLSAITQVNPDPAFQNGMGQSYTCGEFYNLGSNSPKPLTITGTENQDHEISLDISTNKSFEWIEKTYDGRFQPEIGEQVVDFGLRGLRPRH